VAYEIVVIGTSMGGLVALETLLTGLPRGFSLPTAVVQHRGPLSTDRLCATLRRYTDLAVHEAQDKQPILPGCVYIAPPDYHLMVDAGHFALSTEAPVLYARPSIDVLFHSAADVYAERVLAVVLTGASRDGAEGAARVKARGGGVIVQAPETAEAPLMPEAAIEAARPDWILPLDRIGPFLGNFNLAPAGRT
jgi:two-component system, chemotaxis family, protein-glutamate methylesterase/glutaminase